MTVEESPRRTRRAPGTPKRRKAYRPAAVYSAVALLLVAASPACAQELPAYQGHYTTGFETSSFRPCAAEHEDERWWLAADSASWAELTDGVYGPRKEEAGWAFGRAFVRVRGKITETGRYGHMGGYDREIHVTDVLLVASPDSVGCP